MATSILITGGAGFIGSRLARRLVALGHDVALLDNMHPQVHDGRPPEGIPEGIRFFTADVTSGTCWNAVLSLMAPEVVVHLAAETGTGQSLTEATRHGWVNVVGTTEMLDALHRRGVVPRHIVLASSRAVYGEGRWADDEGTPFYAGARTHEALAAGRWDAVSPTGGPAVPLANEAALTEPRPASVYAATKLAQEHVGRAWTAAMCTSFSVLRLQNVYGPGQSPTNSYTGVATQFALAALAGQALDVYEDGQIVRDFVFVDDVVGALASAVGTPPDGVRTVDIGSGRPTTILEVAQILARIAGAPAPVVSGTFRDGDVRAASCRIEAARTELGYDPVTSLEEGLSQLLAGVAAGTGHGEPPSGRA